MTIESYLAFVGASIILILTPGPMVAYIVSTTIRINLRAGLVAVVGSGIVSAVQLGIVALGLYSVMTFAGKAFYILKWLGVAYLFYLGLRTIFSKRAPSMDAYKTNDASDGRILIEAMLVMATNPKAILFHAAFLPVFISPEIPSGPQLFVLAATFLFIGAFFDGFWAFFASRATRITSATGLLMNRVSGGILCVAGFVLASAKQP